MPVDYLVGEHLAARHGFFTRAGGVSTGGYATLNGSLSGGDDPARVAENRARAARALGADPARLLGLHQVHGADVAEVTEPWVVGAGPRADAAVTNRPGVALCVITADCTPVLLCDPETGVVGAVHAGWRGAVAGVIEATVAAMARLGAAPYRIVATIGPSIRQPSYEVASDLRDAVLARHAGDALFFADGTRPGRWQFDLAGYCAMRLRGVFMTETIDADTLPDERRFFSHRRRTLSSGPLSAGGPIGHQMSIIVRDGTWDPTWSS